METIKWSSEMSLGVPEMDTAHEALLNDLRQTVAVSDGNFTAAFLQLIAKIEIDFHQEEQMMEDMDYPGIQSHREQHARVLSALHHIAPRVMEGDINLGREALELLPQWFTQHMSTMDTALAFALELDSEEKKLQSKI